MPPGIFIGSWWSLTRILHKNDPARSKVTAMRQISRLLSSPGAVRASDARLVSGLAAYKTRIEPERREHRRISLACKEMEAEMRKIIFSAVLAALLTATFVGASFAQGGGAGGGAGGAGSAGAGAGGAGAGA